MNIKRICVGGLGVNCYILSEGSEAFVIDPGDEAERILKAAKEDGVSITKIILTHGHFDHFGAAAELKEKTGAKVFIHKEDEIMLSDDTANLCFLTGIAPRHVVCDGYLENGKSIMLGESEIKIFHTPGHSRGSVSLFTGDAVFTGDLLFRGSIGRFDFGSLETELASIGTLLKMLDDNVRILAGHGEESTVGREKKYNPYCIGLS